MQNRPDLNHELRLWQHGAVFLFACAILISRRPDAIFHAQFFAEDGHVWFADDYNVGLWSALFQAHTGYFQTLPRLGAALALLAPFSLAPLVLNLIALAVQALPANLLLSSRSAGWGTLRTRALFAGICLALPNCAEVSSGITESQWLLALCVILVLTASPPRSVAGMGFDCSMLLLCGLTGAFCIPLLPIAFFIVWRHRDRWRWVTSGLLAALCLVQAWALLIVDPSGRKEAALGASPALFARILGGQVYSATLLGHNKLATLPGLPMLLFLVALAIAGTVLVAICIARAPWPLRVFLLFSMMLFALALITPTGSIPDGISAWRHLSTTTSVRYWFFPTLAFAWSVLWCVQSQTGVIKTVSAVLFCVMCFGIVRDWRHPAFTDMHFEEQVKRFEAAPAGTAITIPICPDGWTMELIKHSPGR